MTLREWLLVLRASRDWRMCAGAWLVASLGALFVGRLNPNVPAAVAAYGLPVLAISVMGGSWEFAQRASVWTMLVQRPGAEPARLWSLLRCCLLLYVVAGGIMLAAAIGGLALAPDGGRARLLAFAIDSALWLVVVGAAVAFTSTLRPARTAALSILWLVLPFIIALLREPLALPPAVRNALGFLMPPFDAVWEYSRVVAGELPGEAALYTAQVVAFPVLCLVLVGWRIRVLAQPDRPRPE